MNELLSKQELHSLLEKEAYEETPKMRMSPFLDQARRVGQWKTTCMVLGDGALPELKNEDLLEN